MSIPSTLLCDALRFYNGSPDGQYDRAVVVPLIEAELKYRDLLRQRLERLEREFSSDNPSTGIVRAALKTLDE